VGWGEIPSEVRILPQTPSCRAVRAEKPRRTARTLGGRNRAEISLSFFEFFSGGARKIKIVGEIFCEVAAGALAEAGGGAGAYDFVSSHHALRACVSRGSAQRKFGFRPKGTAKTKVKSLVFSYYPLTPSYYFV
jgi:hypothetical protein